MNLKYNLITIVCSTLILLEQVWATNPEVEEIKVDKSKFLSNIAQINRPNITSIKSIEHDVNLLEQLIPIYRDLISSGQEDQFKESVTVKNCIYALQKKLDEQFASADQRMHRSYQEHYRDFITDLDNEILQTQDLDIQADLKKIQAIIVENQEKLTLQKFENISRIMDEKRKNIKCVKYFKDQQQKIKAEIETQKIDRLKFIEQYSEASPFVMHMDSMLENSQSSYDRNESSLKVLLQESAKLNADIEKMII